MSGARTGSGRPVQPPPGDLIAVCRAHLAGFKTPKRIVVDSIDRTSTGKVQKFALRAHARRLAD